jgi:anti-sigma regulatory factor (Ser/Thr protein kinase)
MTVDLRDVALENGDHVVHFYEREGDLFELVGQHLARAIRAEEPSVVIASETHRRAFETELETAGIDIVEARRTGRLVMFDAATTMTQFMSEGQIDREAFCRVLGGIVDVASDMGRQVHVYGEMVALLWDAGDVLIAIELESLWNDLIEGQQFSLLCAYPSASVAGSEHAEAVRHICDLHSSVVQSAPRPDTPDSPAAEGERTADFAAEPGAPGAARRFVRDTLREWGHADGDLVDEAACVASELATNAVLHAGSGFSVGIRVVPAQHRVRLSVRDASPTMSTVGYSSTPARHGWGLSLVANFASCWGVETTSDAKVVWAEFALA